MIAQLICLHPGKIAFDRFVLEIGGFLLGRSTACDLVVNDATISRRHARITVADASVHVEDLNSLNGTYINDTPLRGNMALLEGSRLRCGSVTLWFHTEASKKEEPELGSAVETAPCEPKVSVSLISPMLSRAQNRVLDQLLRGLAEKQIATRLNISQHTAHNHIRAIFRSFGVHSRSELLAVFVSHPVPDEHFRLNGGLLN